MENLSLLKKSLIHLGVLAFGLIVIMVFLKPQLEGYAINQHDVDQWRGASHEAMTYYEEQGEPALWTNSMFGGMPTDQIFLIYSGNMVKQIVEGYMKILSVPIGLMFLHFLSFYLMAYFLRIRPLIALMGALAFTFCSYEVIVLQAGHTTKSLATAYLPALLGAFIYAFRSNRMWGVILTGVILAFQLSANHLQTTYYFMFVLLFVGICLFIEAVVIKKLKDFFITTAGIVVAVIIAIAANIGNLAMTFDYADNTIRGGNDVTLTPEGLPATAQSKGLDKDYITNWSYGVGETFNLLSPYVKGPGSMALGDSQFREDIENSDLSSEEINSVLNSSAYWGDQPITSGPAYLGIISVLLAFLGLIFLRDPIKWPLFIATILTVMLSWGKNFMGLTDFFIDHIPGYNKFRAVTIILIVAEVTVTVLAALFLEKLIRERERIVEKRGLFLGAIGGFFLFLLIVKFVGLGDNYIGAAERQQAANYKGMVTQQLNQMGAAKVKEQYGVDLENPAQVAQFSEQAEQMFQESQLTVKKVRKEIFNSSMNRSLIFVFLAGLLLALFVFSNASAMKYVTIGGLVLLTMIDVIPVAYNYLGSIENEGGYKFWIEEEYYMYPFAATEADETILQNEIAENPGLKAKIDRAQQKGEALADELEYSGARNNVINSYRFSALNMNTNYRVFDVQGNFNSSTASYFHKSLGGYHGAKLRNIQNVIDYHISRSNSKVFNMLNVKYFIQQSEKGLVATKNDEALGNAWLVESVEIYATPDDEIRALGNRFELTNVGGGSFLVNGERKNTAIVFGAEKLQYLLPGNDTLQVPLTNGMEEGMEALWVMDGKGTTNLVPVMTVKADSLASFKNLVKLKVVNEFKPAAEAVMLKSEAAKIGAKSFTGNGTIKLTSYSPVKLTYSADVQGPQLAVFSEIYYPLGWKAFVDNKEVPILKVDYLLRGLELKGGKHKIEFIYDLPKYHKVNNIALMVSIFMILLIAAALFIQFRKRKKENQASANS